MSNFAILRFQKLHTFPQLTAAQKHNNREIPLPNVDKDQSFKNAVLINPGGTYTAKWKQLKINEEIKQGKSINQRSNSVIAIEAVTSFSRGAIDDKDVMAWAQANVEWFERTFGADHIIASTLHLDEETPHLHTEFIPITDDGRLSAKDVFGGRVGLMRLQTDYGKEMERFGLTRGDKASKSKKKDLKDFYSSVNKAAETQLPERPPGMDLETYLEILREKFKNQALAIAKLKLDLDTANTLTMTRVAQEFSKYSNAVSLYEDIYEKYDGDEDQTNDRIVAYRHLENRLPKNTASDVLDTLIRKLEPNATPLTNWAKKGKAALAGITPKQDSDETQNIIQNNTIQLDNIDEYIDESEYYEDGWEDGNDDSNKYDV